MPRVAHERVEGRRPARIAAVFLDLLDAAEQPQRLKSRLFGRQAAGLQTLGLTFEMELQLFAEIRFAATGKHEGSQPAAQDVPEPLDHVRSSTRLTPADNRSHFATSAVELLAAGPGQRVEARAPIVLGRAPVGGDPALMLEAVERRIERALLDAQQIVGNLLDTLGNRPAVHRLEGDRLA